MGQPAGKTSAKGKANATGFRGVETGWQVRALYLACQSSHGLMKAVEEFHGVSSPAAPNPSAKAVLIPAPSLHTMLRCHQQDAELKLNFRCIAGATWSRDRLLNCRSLSILDWKNALFSPEDVSELIAHA